MATYLPQITDYIPNYQPFQPDLNFFDSALSTKEAKYKYGLQQVNTMYGSLYNSALSRSDTNELRDKFFKDTSEKIKQLSKLDLSHQQNIDAAESLFDPLYSNKLFIDDLSRTKKYQSLLQTNNYYKNCLTGDCAGHYWKEAKQYLDYQMRDYIEASPEDALNMSSPRYVPYVDLFKKATEIANDMNLNVSVDELNGNYIVTTKNGNLIAPSLQQVFMSRLGNDGNLRDVYTVKATIARRQFLDSLPQDMPKEQMYEKYISYINSQLGTDIIDIKKQASETKKEAEQYLNDAKNYVDDKSDDKNYKTYLEVYNDAVEALNDANEIDNQATESVIQYNKSNDNSISIGTRMQAIDNILGYRYLMSDINSAAIIEANKNSEYNIKVNQISMENIKFGYQKTLKQIDFENERDLKILDKMLKDGTYNASLNLSTNKIGKPQFTFKPTKKTYDIINDQYVTQVENITTINTNKKANLLFNILKYRVQSKDNNPSIKAFQRGILNLIRSNKPKATFNAITIEDIKNLGNKYVDKLFNLYVERLRNNKKLSNKFEDIRAFNSTFNDAYYDIDIADKAKKSMTNDYNEARNNTVNSIIESDVIPSKDYETYAMSSTKELLKDNANVTDSKTYNPRTYNYRKILIDSYNAIKNSNNDKSDKAKLFAKTAINLFKTTPTLKSFSDIEIKDGYTEKDLIDIYNKIDKNYEETFVSNYRKPNATTNKAGGSDMEFAPATITYTDPDEVKNILTEATNSDITMISRIGYIKDDKFEPMDTESIYGNTINEIIKRINPNNKLKEGVTISTTDAIDKLYETINIPPGTFTGKKITDVIPKNVIANNKLVIEIDKSKSKDNSIVKNLEQTPIRIAYSKGYTYDFGELGNVTVEPLDDYSYKVAVNMYIKDKDGNIQNYGNSYNAVRGNETSIHKRIMNSFK